MTDQHLAARSRELQAVRLRPWVRSMMFVPANRPDFIAKARGSDADALILDLEDSTPPAEKAAARDVVREHLAANQAAPAVFVRINGLDTRAALDDLDAVVRAGLTGVMVPKVESPADVSTVARLLDWFEDDRGLPPRSVTIVPALETAGAIRAAYEIASTSDRVAYLGGLGVRGGDIERALGYRWTPAGRETLSYRSSVLLDVRAAGVHNPITGMWSIVKDLDGLRAFAEQSRDLGYDGMLCIHPTHLAVINEVFTPSDAELDRDERLVEAIAAGVRGARGAVTFEGEMIDEAMAATARQRLARFRPAAD